MVALSMIQCHGIHHLDVMFDYGVGVLLSTPTHHVVVTILHHILSCHLSIVTT